MKKPIKALCLLAIAAGAINFLTFMVGNQRLGGSAQNGYEADGQYYVADHGNITEVAEDDWQANLLQSRSLAITHPLMLGAMFILLTQEEFPKKMFRGQPEARDHKAEKVLSAGTPKATFSCGGAIGSLPFSGPILKVSVYSAGIYCKPMFMPSFGLLASEITSIDLPTPTHPKAVKIVHRSPEVANPLVLHCAHNKAAVSALTEFKENL